MGPLSTPQPILTPTSNHTKRPSITPLTQQVLLSHSHHRASSFSALERLYHLRGSCEAVQNQLCKTRCTAPVVQIMCVVLWFLTIGLTKVWGPLRTQLIGQETLSRFTVSSLILFKIEVV